MKNNNRRTENPLVLTMGSVNMDAKMIHNKGVAYPELAKTMVPVLIQCGEKAITAQEALIKANDAIIDANNLLIGANEKLMKQYAALMAIKAKPDAMPQSHIRVLEELVEAFEEKQNACKKQREAQDAKINALKAMVSAQDAPIEALKSELGLLQEPCDAE